jgi:hypothetical protein
MELSKRTVVSSFIESTMIGKDQPEVRTEQQVGDLVKSFEKKQRPNGIKHHDYTTQGTVSGRMANHRSNITDLSKYQK